MILQDDISTQIAGRKFTIHFHEPPRVAEKRVFDGEGLCLVWGEIYVSPLATNRERLAILIHEILEASNVRQLSDTLSHIAILKLEEDLAIALWDCGYKAD